MNNFCDVLVVGSGLSGCVSARLLAEHGYKVLVVEEKKHSGGQLFDYKNEAGITVHKYGPHIFHTGIESVWNFVNRFTEFTNYQHRVLSYTDGNYIEFPINRNTLNTVFGLNLSNEQIPYFLNQEVVKSTFNTPVKSFRDAVVSQVGERLYQLFFEKYTEKQWACNPETLSSEIAGRIPVRHNADSRYFTDNYQGMPVHGYSAMINNMLDHENIRILFGCDYFSVKKYFEPKLTVYTGELDRFFDCKYGKLDYRSVRIELKTFDAETFQPVSVVNYPNDYDYTRITEFKKMTGEKSDKTTVCFEYPSGSGLPFYPVLNASNLSMREKYIEEVGHLKTDSFLFIGRLAEYKYYNMDKAIESALSNTRKWIESNR